MLRIVVPGTQMFDDESSAFMTEGDFILELEHSLVSLSKWESIFEKSFLEETDKTPEELLGYIKAMTLTPEVPEEIFHRLSEENLQDINEYIDRRMSATSFSDSRGPKSRVVITSELIYYWLTVFSIPFECENWHLNRLFTLIRIADIHQSRPRRMSRNEIAAHNRQLNAERKARLGTRG